MLQLLVLLQGWIPRQPITDTYTRESVITASVVLGIFLFVILVFGVAAVADFIIALRKKSKQNTPTV
ncbi:MAG: hypothetical protein LBG17_02800 [Bacteroidales bacterium]|jgi:hypothetical protein|nr:hypothetical protein [Bacteroidales bacterium]